MANTSLDESQVIDALDSVFGANSVSHKKKRVKKWLESNRSHKKIEALISTHGLENTTRAAVGVLQRRLAGSVAANSANARVKPGTTSKAQESDADFEGQRSTPTVSHGTKLEQTPDGHEVCIAGGGRNDGANDSKTYSGETLLDQVLTRV